MKQPAARSDILRWVCMAAIAGVAYWFGYYQGSKSATVLDASIAKGEPRAEGNADRAGSVDAEAQAGSRAENVAAPPESLAIEYPESVLAIIDRLDDERSPADALAYIKSGALSDDQRRPALRNLILKWIDGADSLSEEEAAQWRQRIDSITGERFGLEVELGLAIADAPLGPEVQQAWLDNYADHPGRSRLFAGLLAEQFQADPLSILRTSASWTDWEQRRFEQKLFLDWAKQAPESAFDWYTENRNLVDGELGNEIVNTVAYWGPELADKLLASIHNPDQRTIAIREVATSLAEKGTESALDWVDSLQSESERSLALEAVYHATPRGIGAVMSRKDGFPLIRNMVPGGPLESTALAPGDMIVQAREAGGAPIDLYGMPMVDFVNVLRGEPGSEVEIRVLRRSPETSQLEESLVRVKRDVLIIPPSANEKRDG